MAVSFILLLPALNYLVSKKFPLMRKQPALSILSYCHEEMISESIIQNTISIRKTKAIKLPDALIAATAICNDFILLTNNMQILKPLIRCSEKRFLMNDLPLTLHGIKYKCATQRR